MLVTHDLRIARRTADRVVVVDRGQIVEDLPTADLDQATHPVTRDLLAAGLSLSSRKAVSRTALGLLGSWGGSHTNDPTAS